MIIDPVTMRKFPSSVLWMIVMALAVALPSVAEVSPRGAFETDIPIATPSFYHIEPDLHLVYSSQGTNGWLGTGWALSGVSEIRRASQGYGAPSYDASDHFYLDGMELIPCSGAVAGSQLALSPSCKYKEQPQHQDFASRIENFQRIAFDPSVTGGRWFVWSKDGTKRTYTARRSAGFSTTTPFGWHLDSVQDTTGHTVSYTYSQSAEAPGAGQEYLDAITYGTTTVKFISEARSDSNVAATGDALLVTSKRLKTVDVIVSGQQLRAYALVYGTHPGTSRSVLTTVTVYGRDAVLDANGLVTGGSLLPPINFAYAAPDGNAAWSPVRSNVTGKPPGWDGAGPVNSYRGSTQEIDRGLYGTGQFHAGDFDGDGRTDGLYTALSSSTPPSSPQLFLTAQLADGNTRQSTITLPSRFGWNFEDPPFDGRPGLVRLFVGDVNDDGLSDLIILSWDNVDSQKPFGTLVLQLNTALSNGDGTFRLSSGAFQSTMWQTDTLFADARGPQCQVGDVNGDGRADFVCMVQKFDGQQFLGTALSLGDGTFGLNTPPLAIATDPNGGTMVAGNRAPFETRAIAAGDVNADGMADIEILDLRPAEVQACPPDPTGAAACTIHFDLLTAVSNGDGTYRLVRTETPWIRDSGLATAATLYAADLNGDGKADYLSFAGATQMQAGRQLRTIRTGVTNINGGLTLQTQDIPAELSDRKNVLTLGDTNGDGKTDLLVISPLAPGGGINCSPFADTRPLLTRILGNGDGTFALPTRWDDCSISKEIQEPWTSVESFSGLQAADTNGDGLADFLVAFARPGSDQSKAELGVYDNVSRATGLDTRRWIPTDLTGDGREDFLYVLCQQTSSVAYVLIKDRDSGYVLKKTNLPWFANSSLRTWKILDVNGDGRDDLVHIQSTLTVFNSPIFPISIRSFQFDTFLSNGDGTFNHLLAATLSVPAAKGDVGNWRPIDVNGDGKVDLAYLFWSAGNTFPPTGGVSVTSLLSNGDGTWAVQAAKGPFTPKLGPLDFFPGPKLQDTMSWLVMDVDGDGRQDFVRISTNTFSTGIATLFSRGTADWTLKDYLALNGTADGWNGLMTASDAVNWHTIDQNGDGRADLVHVGRTATGMRVHTLLSKGNGDWATFWQDPTFQAPVDLDVLGEITRWSVTDINGDGRGDLIHVTNPGLLMRLDTLFSDGMGGWTSRRDISLDPTGAGNPVSPSWKPTEIDGNGLSDLARIDVSIPGPRNPSQLFVETLTANFPLDLLTSYASYGGDTKIEYSTSSNYSPSDPPHRCFLPLGAIFHVVSSTKTHDGRGMEDTATYGYGCPVWSPVLRTFLGWTDIATGRPQIPNRPQMSDITRYSQTESCETQVQDVQHRGPAGNYIGTRDIISYRRVGSSPPYRCLQNYIDHLENGAGNAAQNVFTYFNYDEFGNTIDVIDQGVQSKTDDKRTTIRTFNAATGPYIVGLPSWEGVTEGVPPATTLRRSRFFCYDGDDGTDSSNCLGLPVKGQLTAVQQVDDLGLYVTNKYMYAAFGNLAAVINPMHFGTTYFYDQALHFFPETVCNALNQCSAMGWDKVLGKINSVTDANNFTTTVDFDAFGRIKTITYPNNTVRHRQYLNSGNPNLQYIHDEMDDGSKSGLWTDSYYDGLGRIYKTIQKGDAEGSNFQQNRVFNDASQRVYQASDWFRTAMPKGATRNFYRKDHYRPIYETFAYDAAGRVVRQTHPDNSFRSWSYGSDNTVASVTSTDELGHTREVDADAYGRPARISETANGQPISTTYTFDALNRPVTITDAAGNLTTLTWDMLGRKTKVDDPNLGLRTNTYYLGGNVKTTTDAKGAIITYTYDALDRLTTKLYPDRSQVVWNYDEPGHGASKGRLTSVNDPTAAGCASGHADDLTYGPMGEVASWTKCIQQRSYTTGFLFDGLGRDKQLTYPDNEMVAYNYDPAGRLFSIPGYLSQVLYSAAGQVLHTANANGTNATYSYDGSRGWLASATHAQGTSHIYDTSYSYYPNGLVHTTSSTTNAANMSYTYDDLDRLTQVTGDVTQSFQYDGVGNMKFNSKVGTYSYPLPGPTACSTNGTPAACLAPHGVTQAGTQTWQYDPNGALSSVFESATGKYKGIDWTFDHKPSVIADFDGTITNYAYDSATNLVAVQNANETLLKYGPLFDYSSTRGLIKRYLANGEVIARKEVGSTYWYHQDERSSTRAITDQYGAIVGRFDFDPFGKVTATTGTSATAGFADHALDVAGGLVYMNARFYDPTIGRFISPDTIVPDPLFSQALNRYSYTYNNPISFTDPSGHQPYDVTTSYQEEPPVTGTYDFWTPDVPFGTSGIATSGGAPGQICSACHGATETYATPFAADKASPKKDPTDKEIMKDLRDMGLTATQIMVYFPHLTAGDLEELDIDVVSGKKRSYEDQYNVGVDMFGKFAGLAKIQAEGLMWFDIASTAAKATEAASIARSQRALKNSEIGASSGIARKFSIFNPSGRLNNCTRCVTSLLDGIVNEDFVMAADEYPAFANAGRMDRVLSYMEEQTLVTFGKKLGPIAGEELLPEGDYVIFNRFTDGVPGHVIFGRSLGGQMWFYDPQVGAGVPWLNEWFVAYPVIYPK